jgi:uncharacterized protein (DUF58 family)
LKLYPTRITFHVAAAGLVMVVLGVLFHNPPLTAFGCAMVLAIAVGRNLALLSVSHLREAGFEMVWKTEGRISRISQGDTLKIVAELRNRGSDDLRGLKVNIMASAYLHVQVDSKELELPRGEKTSITVTINAPRIGRFGLHGVSLDVRGIPVGGDSLYEAPLMFANPHGIEVFPSSRGSRVEARGHKRSRESAESRGRVRGQGEEFRELRELRPGDPFKKIAWKPSARRGKLLMRETDKHSEQSTFILLDTSGALFDGPLGFSAFDQLAKQAYAAVAAAQSRGDMVGFSTVCTEVNAWLKLEKRKRPTENAQVREMFLRSTSFHDAHRTELSEKEIAPRIFEHLRPLAPQGLSGVIANDLDAVADRADSLKHRAPFKLPAPKGLSLRDQRLRHYAEIFGIELAPRITEPGQGIMLALERILTAKKRPSRLEVFGPLPLPQASALEVLRKLKFAGIEVHWRLPEVALSETEQAFAATDAVYTRAALELELAKRDLRAAGIRVYAQKDQASGV